MKITTARRIAQIFFFALFVWLTVVATVGTGWSQWRGWPIAWFLQIDPLVALGTVLTTRSLHPPLGWALLTIVLTILFGRVFCGFICPFGALHQFVSWLGWRGRTARDRIAANGYRPAQAVKYYLLLVLLIAAAGNLPFALLQIGWLDPMALLHRSFNLAVLPAADLGLERLHPGGRLYQGALWVGALLAFLLLLNLILPRFFCRILCPLGALLGIIGRLAPWGIGKTAAKCTECSLCDVACEGACNPMGPIRTSECLMCMNCLDTCVPAEPLGYVPRPSAGGEITAFGVSRRGFVAALAGGLAAAPLARLGGSTKSAWPAGLVRPPGSVAEEEFLARCLKCTACIRVCPTNTLQAAGFAHGWESIWTPVLDNRIGTSGCQLNCVACGHACPTGAIRPLTLEEKFGIGDFAAQGPIRIGLAAVDRGRCLPWAMQRPCIVCEENCPVTPKAIHLSAVEEPVRDASLPLVAIDGAVVQVGGPPLPPGRLATGDYAARLPGEPLSRRIVANTSNTLTLDAEPESAGDGDLPTDGKVDILVRLQRPVVDPERCIGCGICEHECPMTGLRAIRVTADNETRSANRGVLLKASF